MKKDLLNQISQALVQIDPRLSEFNYIMDKVLKLADLECQNCKNCTCENTKPEKEVEDDQS